MSSKRIQFAVAVLCALTSTATSLANPTSCPAVAGKIKHVWGGEIHQPFVLDGNGNMAWTVEEGGRMRRTLDGTTWSFLNTPACVQQRLRGAYFLASTGGRRGWAVGNDGAVMTTGDAGTTWTVLPQVMDANHKPAELWDVHFKDQNNGWLIGNHVLRYTTDGGTVWKDVAVLHPHNPSFVVTSPEYYSLDFTFFANGTYVGLVSAEPGVILRTDSSSSGKKWTVVYDKYDPVSPPSLCSACQPSVGGAALELWDLEFIQGAASAASAKAFVVGGFGFQCGVALSTQDGGNTWTQEFSKDDVCNVLNSPASCTPGPTPSTPSSLYGTTGFSDSTGLTVGYAGAIYLRDPNCATPVWKLQPQIQQGTKLFTQPFRNIDGDGVGAGFGKAYITSMMNGIHKTNSGGTGPSAWSTQTISNDVWRLRGLHFADALNGWAVGQEYRIAKSSDGGKVWTQLAHTPNGNGRLSDVVLSQNQLSGVAVGLTFTNPNNPKIFWLTPGGTWSDTVILPSIVPAGVSQALNDSAWTSGSQFWAVGESGVILKSIDNGQSWSQVSLTPGGGPAITDASLSSVSFVDQNNGYVAGTRAGSGVIYKITNATSATPTWTDMSPVGLNVSELTSIAASGSRAYAVGRKNVAGVDSRVVLRLSGPAFVEEATPATPPCEETDHLATAPLTTRWTAVALSPTTNEVFVGGTCGRFLRYDGALWSELKSLTSFHVTSMSFPSASVGFFHANAGSHGVINTYQP